MCWGDAELSSNYFPCARGFTLPERNTDWHHCLNPLNSWKLVRYILKDFIKNSRFGGIQSAQNFFLKNLISPLCFCLPADPDEVKFNTTHPHYAQMADEFNIIRFSPIWFEVLAPNMYLHITLCLLLAQHQILHAARNSGSCCLC